MCGIAGILTSSSEAMHPDQSAGVARMLRALKHRGPDDEGTWVSERRDAALAHARLAIIDLSPAGHQPMISADGRFVIVFNGEIYNFRALREELEGAGVGFSTHSDTEVLLQLYARLGPRLVHRLRGMFAFCVWDEANRTAFLARDPLGIKPLYYAGIAGGLVFASELRALQASGKVSPATDPAAIMAYLETGSVPEPMTLLRDVRCLPAGHSLMWRDGKITEQRDWRIQFPDEGLKPDEDAVALTRAALLDSIEHHFVSDVPVGVFLSGGIDSTAVLALAQAAGHHHLNTFSIGVDDAGLDESSVASRTAGHFGTQHHEWRIDAYHLAESFPAFLQCMDQPSIDGYNTYTVAGFARKHGMKVVLSGLGGDELFGGYPSFQKVPQIARTGRMLRRIPGLAPLIGTTMEHCLPSLPMRRLGGMLQQQPSLANAYTAFRGIFSHHAARRLTAAYCSIEAADVPAPPTFEVPDADPRDQVSACELSRYMRNQLLKDSDVMSMAHGLELRVPFVDRMLFERVAAVPADTRLQSGKRLLTQAVPEVPEWVANAPKRGFLFPYQKWLSAEWGTAFKDAAKRTGESNPAWYQRWCVFMLDRWLERTT